MAQLALDPNGGKSPLISTRVLTVDATRLARLAARRRTSRSALLRELIRFALDQIEHADTGPP